MNRKVIKAVSVIQIFLCIVSYISMSVHFNTDYKIYALLENTDFVGTILRLSLYIVPGIHLLSGLYGLVFKDKKILLIICIFEVISSALSFLFVSKSEYMLVLSIVALLLSLAYLASILTIKEK